MQVRDCCVLRSLLCFIAIACCTIVVAQNKMTDKTHEVQEVVVTGTGTRNLLKDAPVQTEVITRKMLDSYGGKSLEEILGGLTASFAFGEGDMGSQMQLGGLGNSYILILIDGKRIHGDVGGENDLGLIDPHNIERIEIVKGAQSALYGSDAMAGVINIITKSHSHKGESGVYADNITRYGSYNDVRQHNSVAFSIGKWTSQTNFQLQHTDGWQNTAEEWAEGKVLTDSKNKTVNQYTNWQVAERLTLAPTKNLELYADGTYYIKYINRPQNGKHPSCDVYTYDLRYNNASASIGGKLMPFGTKKKDEVTFSVDWNKHAYFYDYTARTYEYVQLKGEEYGDLNGEWYSVPMYRGQSKLQSDQQRVMAQARGIFYLPYQNTLNTGLEYRYDYLDAPERTENGSASDATAAVYAQDEFTPAKWINITAGLRLVNNRNFGFRLTPKLSAMLATGDFRFRLGWSQGFKTPTVKELHYRYLHVMGSSTFFNIGNTALNPQTNNYYSVNAEYRTSRFSASVTGYMNDLDNMIALVNVPVGEIPAGITTAYLGDGSNNVQARMYKNMEDACTYGIDVNVSYTPLTDLTLNAAYSYLDTEAHLYDSNSNKMHTVTIDGMAHHKWSASVIYGHSFSTKYRLGLNLSTRGSSKRYYQNNGNGAPFQIWRLNTTHDIGSSVSRKGEKANKFSYRIEAGVDNIFNYVDRTMHPYHLGTTSAGTTVYATLNIKFNYGKKVKTNKQITNSRNNNEED